MTRISGVTLDKNKKGEIEKITLTLKRLDKEMQEAVEDFLDHLIVEQRKNEATVTLDEVVKKLDRKHGISRKKK